MRPATDVAPSTRTLITLLIVSLLAAAGLSAFEVGLPLLGKTAMGMDAYTIGLAFAECSLVMFAAQAVAFSPWVPAAATRWFIVPALVLMALGAGAIPLMNSSSWMMLTVGVLAVGSGVLWPVLTYWTSLIAGRAQGAYLGRQTAAASLGQVIGAAGAGVLFGTDAPSVSAFLAIAVLLAVTAAICLPVGAALRKAPRAAAGRPGLVHDRGRLVRLAWGQYATIMAALVLTASLYGLVASETWHGALDGATYAAVIGTPIAFLEIHGTRLPLVASLRRWPFLAMVLVKSLLYAVWIVGGAELSSHLNHMHYRELGQAALHRDVLAAVVLATVIVNLLLAVSRLLGPGMLSSIVSGRYHRPRVEERAFAFVDMRGSVSLADRIGDLRFHAYVAELFAAIERAGFETGGEVLDYIGDQVMLSWPIGRAGDGPLAFLLTLDHHLAPVKAKLRARYGAAVAVRVAMHAGSVVAGEIGEVRRKIMFLGETVNIAARLEQIARDLGADCLVTAALLERFELPAGLLVTPLGRRTVRGRTEPVEVFQLRVGGEPEGAAKSAAAGL